MKCVTYTVEKFSRLTNIISIDFIYKVIKKKDIFIYNFKYYKIRLKRS